MGGGTRMRDMQGASFVAATIALAACGTTLPESADDASTTTNGSDASVVTETGTPSDLDGGDAGRVVLDGGDGCTHAIDEPFAQLGAPWAEKESGGSVDHAPAGGMGGTGALRAEVTAGASSTSAQITREITGPIPKAIRLAFAMNIAAANGQYVELGCTLQLRGNDDETFLAFQPEINGGTLFFDSTKELNGTSISTGSPKPVGTLATAHWYPVVVKVDDITTTGARVSATVDGATPYVSDVTFPAAPVLVRVKCGIDYGQSGAAATVFVDDVTLDLCP